MNSNNLVMIMYVSCCAGWLLMWEGELEEQTMAFRGSSISESTPSTVVSKPLSFAF